MIRRFVGHEQQLIEGGFVCLNTECAVKEMQLRIRTLKDGKISTTNIGRMGRVKTEADIDAYFDGSSPLKVVHQLG